jgi:hypothetical protein
MVAPSWGCRKQNKFLDSREDDFLQAQEDGTVGRVFWPTLTRDFLAIWPDQETENADWEREAEEDKKKAAEEEKNADTSKRKRKKKGKKERVPPVFASHADWEKDRIKVRVFPGRGDFPIHTCLQKIHSWYYNHTSPSRKPKPAVTLTVNAAPVLGCKGLTEEQLYSKKFYLERVKPLVDAQLAVSAVNPKDQMAIRARITRECYEREPEELKEEIRREKQHEEKKRRDTIEMLQNLTRAEDEKDPSPEEYAR